MKQWNCLAPAATVNSKIAQVGCHYNMPGMKLAQTGQNATRKPVSAIPSSFRKPAALGQIGRTVYRARESQKGPFLGNSGGLQRLPDNSAARKAGLAGCFVQPVGEIFRKAHGDCVTHPLKL